MDDKGTDGQADGQKRQRHEGVDDVQPSSPKKKLREKSETEGEKDSAPKEQEIEAEGVKRTGQNFGKSPQCASMPTSQRHWIGLAQCFAGHVVDKYDPKIKFRSDRDEFGQDTALMLLNERMDRFRLTKAAFEGLSHEDSLEEGVAEPAGRAAIVVMKCEDDQAHGIRRTAVDLLVKAVRSCKSLL